MFYSRSNYRTQWCSSILQLGGTNTNKKSSIKVTIGNNTFDSKGIQKCINRNVPGITARQFARFYANHIFKVAVKNDFVGSAWNSIRRSYSENFNTEDPNSIYYKYWATEFQGDNPDCPEGVTDALHRRVKDRFSKEKSVNQKEFILDKYKCLNRC